MCSRCSNERCAVFLVALVLVGCAKTADDASAPANGVAANQDEAPPAADRGGPHNAADFDEVAARAKAAFDDHEEIEELIFPKGWVKRRTRVLESSHEIVAEDQQGMPREAVARLVYQQRCSKVHATRDEAAADEQLLPTAPQATREAMEQAASEAPNEPIELEIRYAFEDGAWHRTGWSTTPETVHGRSWLDRLGVP